MGNLMLSHWSISQHDFLYLRRFKRSLQSMCPKKVCCSCHVVDRLPFPARSGKIPRSKAERYLLGPIPLNSSVYDHVYTGYVPTYCCCDHGYVHLEAQLHPQCEPAFYGPHPGSPPELQGWGNGPPVRVVLHPGIESGSDAWRMRLIH